MRFRAKGAALGVVLGTTAVLGLVTGTGYAAPYGGGAQITSDTLVVATGGPITIHLTGFVPAEVVTGDLASRIIRVFNATVDANGNLDVTFKIPCGFSPGLHHVIANGATGDTATLDITVTGTDPSCPAGGNGGGGGEHGPGDHHDRDHRDHDGYGHDGYDHDDDGYDGHGDSPATGAEDWYGDPEDGNHGGLPRSGAAVAGMALTSAALLIGGTALARRRRD